MTTDEAIQQAREAVWRKKAMAAATRNLELMRQLYASFYDPEAEDEAAYEAYLNGETDEYDDGRPY